MSLGSILGKIGMAAAPIIAAPFTGGLSLSALPAILGAGGAALGALSQGGAQNRDAQFSGQMDLAQLLMQRDTALQNLRAQADNDYTANQIAREQSGMATRGDAWHKLLAAQHTLSPGAQPQLAGPYNIAPRQATDVERQGADALSAEVMQRLQGGNPIAAVTKRDPRFDYDPLSTIDPRLLKAGKLEKLGGILSPILGIGGAALGASTGRIRPLAGATTPGSPALSAVDLSYLRSRNPQFVS